MFNKAERARRVRIVEEHEQRLNAEIAINAELPLSALRELQDNNNRALSPQASRALAPISQGLRRCGPQEDGVGEVIGNCADCDSIAPLAPVAGHRSGTEYLLCDRCAAYPSDLYYEPPTWPYMAAIWVVAGIIWTLLGLVVYYG